MAEKSGVFLLQEGGNLIGMEPAEFATEDVFQSLLQRFPELLVGDQIDPVTPRRWILVKREQAVGTGEIGSPVWAIDHVFLDQDGVPTLVEIKRQSDPRIRREVVGQMLDYAANCGHYWSAESLQQAFENTCAAMGKSVDELMLALIGQDGNVEDFWRRVRDNLATKNIRLLFVADHIPVELRRVVEFMNEQMREVEVLAVELRQFSAGALKAIVPTVYGQTQLAAQKKTAGRIWDEVSFFDKLRQTAGDKELALAEQIYSWMKKDGRRAIKFGSGQTDGSVYPVLNVGNTRINPVYLSSNGKLYLQFGSLENKPIFGPLETRRELLRRLNSISGVGLSESDLTKYPGIPLKTLASSADGPSKIASALDWIDKEVDKYSDSQPSP